MRLQQLVLGGLFGLACAQFPPKREGITWINSKLHENVSISYKEPGICETTPGVKSYSGYVHLPPGLIDAGSDVAQNYPINTFFWFFEARKDPANAPLAIWLNGGPGASSMMGVLEENGPCYVHNDSKTTYLNPWSWNNEVNMLYLDQPAQVGFSYDVLTNATWKVGADGGFTIVPTNFTDDNLPVTNLTSHYGTFGSQSQSQTANTTAQAAHALWYFVQTWVSEFPHYKPINDRISLWTESYGGHYGPGFMSFFQQQNEKISKGRETYIQFPYNNTYGIQTFTQEIHDELLHNWTKPDGCRQRMTECQAALKLYDAGKKVDDLAAVCENVEDDCWTDLLRLYSRQGRAVYDIAHPAKDPFPTPYMYGYLSHAPVLAALGVPVNYTETAAAVAKAFVKSYDMLRGGFLEAAASLIDNGVKVHMVYGDRDFACNWMGGEKASLAVPFSRADEFRAAGYEQMMAASSDYVPASHLELLDGKDTGLSQELVAAGMTRQVGNFSFTRVFQAGHEVPAYQPAGAYAVFMRAMFGRDVPTGKRHVSEDLVTAGPTDTWHVKNVPPPYPEPRCYVLKPASCTTEVWEKVKKGLVVVEDYFVVKVLDEPAGGHNGTIAK
ncbi:uncharacterized protein PG986_010205 [Apiospora aurea]|uniref:Carboxypeptidase n=1 Tax=Apiospora aurea TaxID=335848 RepID=A0ABR1QA85_9PEZI